jgi:aminoglycoside 6'-N-acetyltransferase I
MRQMPYDERLAVEIRPIASEDAETWTKLRCALWPDGVEDHAAEIVAFFAGTLIEPLAVLVAVTEGGSICGFAELSIRTDLPGLKEQRVGYVEGLYVVPEARWRGVARALLNASRHWAQAQHCSASASDRADRLVVDRRYRSSGNRSALRSLERSQA